MRALLGKLLAREELTEEEAETLLARLMEPELEAILAGAVLAALRVRGECAAELRGFARGMRRLARPLRLESDAPLVDIVGTGGDGSGSLNLSTASALLATACGLRVAKHGNRSVSSKSGSADVLEALGLPMPLDERQARACFERSGFTFAFAPFYHGAMKAVAPVRRALATRTIFNMLGPLTNPADPEYLVVGAFSEDCAMLMAEALSGLGVRRAFVVHGEPGWDEATPCGPFLLFDVQEGRVSSQTRDPRDLGLERCAPSALLGADAGANAQAIVRVFEGERSAHRNALVLTTALALEVSGVVPDPQHALALAEKHLDDGSAARVLDEIRRFGHSIRYGEGKADA